MLFHRPTWLLLSVLFLCAQHMLFVSSIQHIFRHESPDHYTTLKFDNLPSTNALTNLTHYSHLSFSSFSYFNASHAASTSLISPPDSNCAWSSPNALFAWRKLNPKVWPRFTLNAAHAAQNGLSPYFDLVGLAVKCMNETPPYSQVFVQAWGIDFTNVTEPVIRQSYVMVWTNTRAGVQMQYPIDCADLFPNWGRGVNMVEMWAVTEAGEDWPFCVDDIRVRFHNATESESEETLELPRSWEMVKVCGQGLILHAKSST